MWLWVFPAVAGIVRACAAARDLIIKYPEAFTDFEITKGKMDDVFLAVTGIKGGEDK